MKLERNAVAREKIANLVATRGPLVTNEPVDGKVGPVRQGPGGEGLLHLRIQPFFRCHPAFDGPEVDVAQGDSPPQRRQLAEGNPGVVLVHGDKEETSRARVQRMASSQQLDPVRSGQV